MDDGDDFWRRERSGRRGGEGQNDTVKYPIWAVLALMVAQVFSSVSYSALNAVLALYFTTALSFDQGQSTVLCSVFQLVSMIAGSVFGGFLTDYWLGNFRTQFWSYILWVVGSALQFATTFSIVKSPDALGTHGAQITAVLSVVVFQAIGCQSSFSVPAKPIYVPPPSRFPLVVAPPLGLLSPDSLLPFSGQTAW
jgi:dipeptide/tripeptide permease